MSDDDLDSLDESGLDESAGAPPGGGGGGLKAKIQQLIPLIFAVIIGVTISSVISYIVIGNMEKGRKALPPKTRSEQEDNSGSLAYFTLIEQIRTRTADRPPQSVIVTVQLGYDEKNEALFSELSKRIPFFTDQIRNFFSNKTAAEMAPENEAALKNELKMRINDYLLSEPGIENVIFPEFQIIEM